ncbi:MAG: ParB/RepB/Spo0J family partition protein [Bdellovibrionaceae bacterium]|nr:ParB/RepB/Spo0J family partition protein [Pseudobdellovibrionaceae bacterium]
MSEISTENSKQKRGLGRGLGSLLGGPAQEAPTPAPVARTPVSTAVSTPAKPAAAAAPAPSVTAPPPVAPPVMTEGKVWQIGIDKLKGGAFQPRRDFNKEALQELAQSIKENGILQPIIVRKTKSGGFEIVAGERRWRAAQLAGLHEVPVLIRNFEDKEALELAIIENVQREDLSPIEEAEGYSRLSTEFHLSQQQIAERVGKDRATVANAIRLLLLPSEVKTMIGSGELSVGHAKVLLSLPDPKKQTEFAKKVMAEKIPVRKLEKLIAATLSGKTESTTENGANAGTMNQLVSALSDELQKMLGTKVAIDYADGRGKISISFYSNEELNQIVDQLKSGHQREKNGQR